MRQAAGRNSCRFNGEEMTRVKTTRVDRQKKVIVMLDINRAFRDDSGCALRHCIVARFTKRCTSLIVTTNLPFADWPEVFAEDERLAGALLDRLTHHVHILDIIADSYRLKSSLEKGKEKKKRQ